MNDIILSTQNGEPVASSREVAKRFGALTCIYLALLSSRGCAKLRRPPKISQRKIAL